MLNDPTAFQAKFDVSRETMDSLNQFADLVIKWNKSINLISRSSIPEIWHRHLADSAQLFKIADPSSDHNWIDIGTGGGFPGIVISILSKQQRPNLSVQLIESDGRKCAFLRTVIRALELNCTVLESRIEEIPELSADVFSARAFSNLSNLIEIIAKHAGPDTKSYFLKGMSHDVELTEARENWHIDVTHFPSMTDTTASILKVKGQPVAKTN